MRVSLDAELELAVGKEQYAQWHLLNRSAARAPAAARDHGEGCGDAVDREGADQFQRRVVVQVGLAEGA
jgi:hypothetical protein